MVAERVGRAADPRLVRGVARAARAGRRSRRRARRGGAGTGDRRRLDDRLPLQARLGRARPRPATRTEIVVARDEFPTDRYVLESLAAARGLELRWLEADPVDGPSAEDVAALLGPRTALVVLSHVNYRSAAIAPLEEITSARPRRRRARPLGSLPQRRRAARRARRGRAPTSPSAAPTSTSTAGPGAPAFLYVRRATSRRGCSQPIWGWFGRRDQFLMEQGYEPADGHLRPGCRGRRTCSAWLPSRRAPGSPPRRGIPAIRAKARALTEYAIELHDERLAPLGFTLGSPRDAERRGAHVSVCRADAAALCRLARRGRRAHRLPDARRDPARLLAAHDELRRGLGRRRPSLRARSSGLSSCWAATAAPARRRPPTVTSRPPVSPDGRRISTSAITAPSATSREPRREVDVERRCGCPARRRSGTSSGR